MHSPRPRARICYDKQPVEVMTSPVKKSTFTVLDGLRVPSSRPCSGANEHRPDARFYCGIMVYLGCTFTIQPKRVRVVGIVPRKTLEKRVAIRAIGWKNPRFQLVYFGMKIHYFLSAIVVGEKNRPFLRRCPSLTNQHSWAALRGVGD